MNTPFLGTMRSTTSTILDKLCIAPSRPQGCCLFQQSLYFQDGVHIWTVLSKLLEAI